MPEQQQVRDANNYYLLRSKARTGLLLFERRKTQLALVFEKYRTKTKFEFGDTPIKSRQKKFIISGDQFTGLLSGADIPNVQQVLTQTDEKIIELAQLDNGFEYYSINAMSLIINIQPSPEEGIYTPMRSFNPEEFAQIMKDVRYALYVQNMVQMAWKIGALQDEELADLISNEE